MQREWVGLAPPGGTRAPHGSHPGQGLYHRPATDPSVAFLAAHYSVDFSEHYLAEPLARRGYGFLGFNTRFRGADTYFRYGPALADLAAAVGWLRREAGVERVVLLGNSGGASLMAALQAEQGDGDLYVSLNAHPGRPQVLTGWLDPAVVDETDPLSVDPDLDLFASGRQAPLDPGYVARYRAAQRARNERITDWARRELRRLEPAGAHDRLFTVPRTWADPRFVDLSLDPSQRRPGCYAGDPRTANYGPFGLAATVTAGTWLQMWSLAGDRTERDLAAVQVPALVVQATGDRGVFPSDARRVHELLGGADKTLEWLPGEHYFEDTGPEAAAELVSSWVASRS